MGTCYSASECASKGNFLFLVLDLNERKYISIPLQGAPTLAAVPVGSEFAAPGVWAVAPQLISTTPTSPAPGPAPPALSRCDILTKMRRGVKI